LIDHGPLRSSREIVLESFNAPGWSFSERFNTSIRAVAHITHNLMPCCCSLREETIPDALNLTSNEKLSCYSLHVR
jgi:hypothetical protein